jgi:GntR family transcriptional regulator
MAVKLRINPNTVARAYRELEHEGVVVTMRGKGVFVSNSPRVGDERRALAAIKETLDGILVEAFHMGISAEQVRELLDGRIEDLARKREG